MAPHQVIASLGLVLDIIGAIYVVKGLVAMSDDEIALASDRVAVYGGPNVANAPQVFPRKALQKIFTDSRRDARVGAVLLALGFGGQLLAVWI